MLTFRYVHYWVSETWFATCSLIFLHPSNKYPTANEIERIILAKISCHEREKELYSLIKAYLIHGPCGSINRWSLCMKDKHCSKYYHKKFQNSIVVDQDGCPMYRRRDSSRTIIKNGVTIKNHSVVPYNPLLLMKYQTHINLESCN